MIQYDCQEVRALASKVQIGTPRTSGAQRLQRKHSDTERLWVEVPHAKPFRHIWLNGITAEQRTVNA